ncbi:MAG: hypothetical protein PHG65_09535, partial [Kiritimatiellae bacterium]|nr:hypothetical protein [Kiritimatiellia bacterium]
MKRKRSQTRDEKGRCVPPFWRSGLAALLLGLLPGMTGCSDVYREVLDRPLGREVIRDPSAWWGATEGNATVYAQNPELLQEALDKISFSRTRAARLVGAPVEAEQDVCFYLVQDKALWRELSQKYAIHSNTVSLAVGNEVVCLARTREELVGDAAP